MTFCIKRLYIAAWMKNANLSTFRRCFFPCCAWQNMSKISRVTGKKSLLCCIKRFYMKIEFTVAAKHVQQLTEQILMTKHRFFLLIHWMGAQTALLCVTQSDVTQHSYKLSFFLSLSPVSWGVPCDLHVKVCAIGPSDPFHDWQVAQDMSQQGQMSRCHSCHYYLGARQVKLNCAAEASGFIGISQRLNGAPRLLSLFHTEPTLPGGFKQSMKLINEYLWSS